MIRTLISLFVCMATFTAHALAPMSDAVALKKAYDNLHYSLTVEWDQQDKDFYNNKMEEFKSEIKDLQKKGLTNEQLINFSKLQMKDEKLAKDLDQLMSTVQLNKLNESEARKLVMEHMSKNYNQGASWSSSGEVVLWTLIIVAILVAVASGGGSSSVYIGDTCYDEYVCYDYYDDWGYYWYTDCYWETYCY